MPVNPRNLRNLKAQGERARNGTSSASERGLPVNMSPDAPAPVDFSQETSRYIGISETSRSSDLGEWVDIPFRQYKGMAVLIRTNRPSKVRLLKPYAGYDPATRAAVRRQDKAQFAFDQHQGNKELVPDDVYEEYIEATEEATQAIRAFQKDLAYRTCEWLANFVEDFDPWPFDDIEKPDPSDPKSYHVLYDSLEDIYNWLFREGGGYDQALQASAKNS